MDKLEEMDRFLEKLNLPKLNKEEIEIMNNPITSTEIEAVIKNLTRKQNNSKPMGCSKSSSKREVYNNTILPQETRKTSNRQLNFTPKTTGKRRTNKSPN